MKSVQLVWVSLLLTLAAALTGCNSGYSGGDRILSARIENATSVPVVATFSVGERLSQAPGMRELVSASTSIIPAGSSIDYTMRCPPGYRVDRESGLRGVARVKIETVAATWDAPSFAWFEAVGKFPSSLKILGAPDALSLTASDGRMEPVPREWWPGGRSE